VGRRIGLAALAAAVLVLALTGSTPTLYFASTTLVYVGLALGLDLVWGHLGILSLGHAAFFGAGAYVVALGTRAGWPADILLFLPLAVVTGIASPSLWASSCSRADAA